MNLGNNGANSINQGIGSVFRTLASAPLVRQQAEDQAALNAARIFAQNMTGQKHGAEAEGLNYTNQRRMTVPDQIAAEPTMAPQMQAILKAFQNTGDANIERYAKGAGEFQQQQAITDIQGGMDPTRTGQAFAAVSGKMPFSDVGATGRNINGLTGLGSIVEQGLAGNYDKKIAAEANADNARAGNSSAGANLDIEKLRFLKEKGAMPGSGAEGSEGALSSNILNTIRIPSLDAKGRPARNPMTGEVETTIDPKAQNDFYKWVTNNNRRPTAAAFAQWEANGRPTASSAKSPPPQPARQTIDAPRNAAQRSAGTIYNTPKGPLKWTGTGWMTP